MQRHTFPLLCCLLSVATPAMAEEGMWLFNAFPAERVEQAYGFRPDQAFLDRVRLASVRFSSGGSGAFVSGRGLMLTNHHVGRECIARLSSPDHDLEESGYLAPPDREPRCPDLDVTVLQGIKDVTAQVLDAQDPAASLADRNRSRQEMILQLEKSCSSQSGLKCTVVTLYGGGAYHLYQYKRYDDVRLVFAPETAMAFYGGDVANFEYPRYALDIAFFRAYENGVPAQVTSFLPMNPTGAREGDLVFVSGNPGRTQRHLSIAELTFLREVSYPFTLNALRRAEARLSTFSQRSPEMARQAQSAWFMFANRRKRTLGLQSGLQSEIRMAPRIAQEQAFRAAIANHPRAAEWLPAFDALQRAQERHRALYVRYQVLETAIDRSAFTMLRMARTLVRLPNETALPNDKRLPEYSDAALPSLEQRLYSSAPVYRDLEIAMLSWWLELLSDSLGSRDPLVLRLMIGKNIEATAAAYVAETRIDDLEVRRAMARGGQKAISSARDPLIGLARSIDQAARQARRQYEDEVEAVEREAHAKLTEARYALYGQTQYPDATFSLRLGYGRVKGYEQDGQYLPYATTVGGVFQSAAQQGNQPPWEVSERWIAGKTRLNLEAPLDFVCTVDTTGGSSGSPMINQKGELVGVAFDSNRHKIANDLVYSEDQARAIAIHASGMLEALRNVYGAADVLAELMPPPPASATPVGATPVGATPASGLP